MRWKSSRAQHHQMQKWCVLVLPGFFKRNKSAHACNNRRKKNKFVKSQMHSELQSRIVSCRRSLHDREVQHEHIQFNSQNFLNLEHKEAKLRVQWETEALMMTCTKESFLGTSESERQGAIRAQELAVALRCEMTQETTACASWKSDLIKLTKRGRGAKQEDNGWVKLCTLLIFSSTTTTNGLFATLHADRKKLSHHRPAEGHPWEHIPSTCTPLSDTGSVADVSSSKGMKQRNSTEKGAG